MKKKHRRALLLVPILGLTAGAITWWKLGPNHGPAGTGAITAKVVRRDLSSTVLATGAIKAQVGAEVRVGARISGKVEHLHANIGDMVAKGQTVAELEKADLEARVRQRTAELETAEAKHSAVKSLRPREIEKAEADVAQWQATVNLNP